jgi:hypothetical protein
MYKSRKISGSTLNDTYAENENPIFEIIHRYEK